MKQTFVYRSNGTQKHARSYFRFLLAMKLLLKQSHTHCSYTLTNWSSLLAVTTWHRPHPYNTMTNGLEPPPYIDFLLPLHVYIVNSSITDHLAHITCISYWFVNMKCVNVTFLIKILRQLLRNGRLNDCLVKPIIFTDVFIHYPSPWPMVPALYAFVNIMA